MSIEKNTKMGFKIPTGSRGFKGVVPKDQLTSGSLIQDLRESAVRAENSLAGQIQAEAQRSLDGYARLKLTRTREDALSERYIQGAVDALSFLRGQMDPDHPFARWMFSNGVGRPFLGSDSEDA